MVTGDGEEAVVEDEGLEGTVDEDAEDTLGDEGIIDAEEDGEEEDEGTGAHDVDITSYFPVAQVSAGKVSEVLVSVKVRYVFIIDSVFSVFNMYLYFR